MAIKRRLLFDASAWVLLAKGLAITPLALYAIRRSRREGGTATAMAVILCVAAIVALVGAIGAAWAARRTA